VDILGQLAPYETGCIQITGPNLPQFLLKIFCLIFFPQNDVVRFANSFSFVFFPGERDKECRSWGAGRRWEGERLCLRLLVYAGLFIIESGSDYVWNENWQMQVFLRTESWRASGSRSRICLHSVFFPLAQDRI